MEEEGNIIPQIVRPKASTFPTLASVASAAASSSSSSSCTSTCIADNSANEFNSEQRKVTFDFSNLDWSPEPPAGTHFLGTQPKDYVLPGGAGGSSSGQWNWQSQQHAFNGKVVRKKSRLRSRRGAVSLTKSPVGLDLVAERKLRKAANAGDAEEVDRLLKDEINPNRCDEKGRTALHFAASKGAQAVVQLLLSNGADPNKTDAIGNTPLHLAAIGSHIGTVLTLLQNRADVHALDKSGRTPIHLARVRISHICGQNLFSFRLKDEVKQVINMLKAYMNCLGKDDKVLALENIGIQLQHTTNKKEMDEVQSMLEGFTTMSLDS